jgi:hypothetical protein
MSYSNPATRSDTAKNPKGKGTVTTASSTLIPANPDRLAAYVTNNAEVTCWLALGATAVAKEGIRLGKEQLPLRIAGYSGVITAITETGETTVAWAEI